MATVYEIKIKTVSDNINYPPEKIEQELTKFLQQRTGLNMSKTLVKVERVN